MKKKTFKKMSTATLTAALATAAVVPAAVAETPVSVEQTISNVLVEVNGNLVSLTLNQYVELLDEKAMYPDEITFEVSSLKYVVLSSGKTFTIEEYSEFLDEMAIEYRGESSDTIINATLALLDESGTVQEDLKVVEGTIGNDGNIVDPTPEENVIETFFYNFAA